jgi:ABC-type Mn2+/Zn2+ transport system ATPase subunit
VLAAVHDLPLAQRVFEQAVLLSTKLVAAGPIAEVMAA